jgi:hypothetical protein
MPAESRKPVILDSVTHLDDSHKGAVTHCASHGGTYAAYYAATKGVGAVILNDAGIGRERAGVAGLLLLERLGVPGAAISHRSARIGDGKDGYTRGMLSTVNAPAASHGLRAGMTCREALDMLLRADIAAAPQPTKEQEFRTEITEAGRADVKVVAMDSISLVKPEDAGHLIVAASHGALLAGKPETAVKYPVFACVTNDADRGIDDAGISRLPALDARGIAGACVSAFSARIGDGMSMYRDGYVSFLNGVAAKRGGRIGQSCPEFIAAMIAARLEGR